VRGGIPFGAEQIEIALRIADAWLPEARAIVDLGCGDGIVGEAALHVWPNATLALVDFSPRMLEGARERFGTRENVRTVEADFGDPTWTATLGDGFQADLVLSAYAIHHQEDDRKQSLYREIYELLEPGGVFLNIEHVSSPTTAVAKLNDEMFIDTLTAHQQALGSTRSRDEIAQQFYFRPDKAANRLAPVERQLAWLRDIGFTEVDCFFKIFELAVFGGRKPGGSRQ
jgi:SAM-dependent methyltransferase